MLLMRSALAALAPGAPGWAAMPAFGASLIQATASGLTPRAAACVCRIPAARRSGLFAPAAGKPTAAIAVASGPARKKTMTDLAGNGTGRLAQRYCHMVAGAPIRADAICGLAAFGIG